MESVQEIISVLEKLLDAHEQLLRLEEQKQRVLIEDRTGELMPLLHEQSRLVKHISLLEQERQITLEKYLRKFGINQRPFALSDLLKLVTSYQEKESLRECSENLQVIIKQLKQLNQLNQELIEQSLSYINFSLRLVTEEPDRYATYSREDLSAKQTAGQHRSFFDTKA